jgi:hypothetical protein
MAKIAQQTSVAAMLSTADALAHRDVFMADQGPEKRRYAWYK